MAKSEFHEALADLTHLQKAFVLEYARCNFNGTEAADRAGYKAKNRNTLASIASENLRKPKIRKAIDLLLKERVLSAEEVLALLSDQARSAHAQYFVMKPVKKDDGTVIGHYPAFDFEACRADGNAHLIKEIKYPASGSIEFRFHDAQAALITIGKHLNLFKEPDVNVEVNLGLSADDLARLDQQANDEVSEFEERLLNGDSDLPKGVDGNPGP